MSATVWRITAAAGTIEVNDGADVDGVEVWGNIPEGWDAAEATTEHDQRVDGDGAVTYAQRLGPRQLNGPFRVFCPTKALAENRRNLVEAIHEELVTVEGLLVVDEIATSKSLDVLSWRKPIIRIRSATSFDVRAWPLLAPNPAKANYP